MVQDLPPEEVLESAAARVRPLILNDEPSYSLGTVKALSYFLREQSSPPSVVSYLQRLTTLWKSFDSRSTESAAYLVQVGRVDGSEPTTSLSDTELAYAWIYGDVVHGDPERLSATQRHGVRERYRAAAPVVCRIMRAALVTLDFIEQLRELGLLELDDDVFERAVVVGDEPFRDRAAIHMAPYVEGQPPPVPDLVKGELGPEWRELTMSEAAQMHIALSAGDTIDEELPK